jgi:putative ABC transport system permease protein
VPLVVDDVDRLRRETTLVTARSPVIVTRSRVIASGGNRRSEVNGVSRDYLTIRNRSVVSGALFDDFDVQAKRRVVALGATVAQDRLSGFTVLGQILASTASPKDVAGA